MIVVERIECHVGLTKLSNRRLADPVLHAHFDDVTQTAHYYTLT